MCDTIPSVSLRYIIPPNGIQTGKTQGWETTAHLLGDALRSTGFVYLTDHGIPLEKIQKFFKVSKDYFKLPVEEKEKVPRDFENTFHGYTKIGEEVFTRNAIELRETFDVSVQNRSHLPYPTTSASALRPSSLELVEECNNLAKVILKLLPTALGLEDSEALSKYHKIVADPTAENYSQLRTLYYPKINCIQGEPSAVGQIRCGAHTDFGTFTFLFEDAIGGLEVRGKDGRWIHSSPRPGSVLMNTADLLHIWSGGQFPSTLHRVTVPACEVKRRVARQSIAFFLKPENDTVVTPLAGMRTVSEFMQNNADIEVNAGEHFRRRTRNIRNTYQSDHTLPSSL